jgi:hypothetical protein
VPKRLRHVLPSRLIAEQLAEPVEQAQRGRYPRLVHLRAPGHQQPGHVPTAVPDGVRPPPTWTCLL